MAQLMWTKTDMCPDKEDLNIRVEMCTHMGLFQWIAMDIHTMKLVAKLILAKNKGQYYLIYH